MEAGKGCSYAIPVSPNRTCYHFVYLLLVSHCKGLQWDTSFFFSNILCAEVISQQMTSAYITCIMEPRTVLAMSIQYMRLTWHSAPVLYGAALQNIFVNEFYGLPFTMYNSYLGPCTANGHRSLPDAVCSCRLSAMRAGPCLMSLMAPMTALQPSSNKALSPSLSTCWAVGICLFRSGRL